MQIFYKALVVENDSGNADRRIKVRVMGIHPFEGELDYSNVPDEALPWAKIAPSISSSNSKEKFNVPEIGQWVWVFFEDEGFQQPIYFAFVTADTDVNENFKPNKNTITIDRYNGQEQVVTNDYQSNITNGNGFFLSSTEHKALLTNNSVATVLTDNKIKNYVGRDIDESEQSMVYGNHLLDCLQSTLSTLEQSFKGFKDEYSNYNDSNNPIDIPNSIGERIPDAMPFNLDKLEDQSLIDDETTLKAIEDQNATKPTDEQIKIPQMNDIMKNIPLDLSMADIKEKILEGIVDAGKSLEKTVAMGSVWIGEPFYTARISLAFLRLYKIIDNLYKRVVYLEGKEIENLEINTKEFSEGISDRYKGIKEVSDNLKNTLNNYSVFVPEAQDLNQLIIDEYANGESPKSISFDSNFNSIKCKEMKPENIKYIIVHCSDSDFGDAELINKWHQQNGWCKIGYQYVILNGCKTNKEYKDKKEGKPTSYIDGMVQTGRKETEIGAHTVGYNHNSIGICLIGNKISLAENAPQIASLKTLIESLREKYNIPKENILRHCETPKANGKTCPNIDNDEWKVFKATLKS